VSPRGTLVGGYRSTATGLLLPIASLVTAPILARGLGVAQRGTLAVYIASLTLAVYVTTFGQQEAQSTFLARGWVTSSWLARKRRSTVLVVSGISLCAAIPFLFFGVPSEWLILLGFLPCLVWQQTLRGQLQGSQTFGLLLLERGLGTVLRLGILVVLFVNNDITVFRALLVQLLSMTLPLVVLYPWVRQAEGDPAQGVQDAMVGYWSFAATAWLGGLATSIMLRLDQLLMSPLSGPKQLGYYAVAVSVAEVPVLLSASLRLSLTPSLARKGEAVLRDTVQRLLTLGLLFVVGALAPLYFVVPVAFGDRYDGARVPALLLLAACYPLFLIDVAEAHLQARGIAKGRLQATSASALLTVLLLPPLVVTMGAIGAALTSLIAYTVAAVVVLRLLRSTFDTQLPLPSLAALVPLVHSRWMHRHPDEDDREY
jgi:O-antigen/teichoic acid export membrane protein